MRKENGSLNPPLAASAASSWNSRRTRMARYSQAPASPASAPPPYSQRASITCASSAHPTSAAEIATAIALTMTMRPVMRASTLRG